MFVSGKSTLRSFAGRLGAAAGTSGYEYHLNQEKQRVQQDQKDGKIRADEVHIRLDQISHDSFIQ